MMDGPEVIAGPITPLLSLLSPLHSQCVPYNGLFITLMFIWMHERYNIFGILVSSIVSTWALTIERSIDMIVIVYLSCCGDLYDFSGVDYNTAMQILIAYDESHQTLNDWNSTPVEFRKRDCSCNGCRY